MTDKKRALNNKRSSHTNIAGTGTPIVHIHLELYSHALADPHTFIDITHAKVQDALISGATIGLIFVDAPWPAKPVDAPTEVPSQARLSDRRRRSATSQC